jgi:putative ABC transport system permease protein
MRQSLRTFDSWWLDVKLGVRVLLKYPGLALVGVLGIGVAVAIAAGGFSFMHDNFLSPSLPFEESDRMVSIEMWDSAANKAERRILRDYRFWREGLKTIQDLGVFRAVPTNMIVAGGQPENVLVVAMTAAGFRLTRVPPLIGRSLVENDEGEGAPNVLVIGEEMWRKRFQADPSILGQSIQLGATSFSIVGVMPEKFKFPVNDRLWMPLRASYRLAEPLSGPDLMVFGRLAPGATIERAQSELAAIVHDTTAQAYPGIYSKLRPQVMPYYYPYVGLRDAQDANGLLLTNLVTIMLLVAVCLNVAILVYTRTAMRQAEISVRSALGATRGRIVAQLFVEALVLSVAGAVVGIAIAALTLRFAARATSGIASQLPFWLTFRLSPVAVMYAVALSVLGAAIVGILPAIKATSRVIHSGARIAGSGGSGMQFGGTWTLLIMAQVAFAVMLLPPAVFNAWKNLRAEWIKPGFAAEEFLTAQLGVDNAPDSAADPREFSRRFAGRQTELARRIQAEPRVSSATFAMAVPGSEPIAAVVASGSPVRVRFNRVDTDFFSALGVPILTGRGFKPSDVDSAGAVAVVVNQSFALRVFGGNALGQRIRYVEGSDSGAAYEIVGIVRDFPAGVSPGMNDSQLRLYHPVAAGSVQPAIMMLRVRGGAPSTFAPRLSELAISVDPNLQLRNIISLDEALHQEQWIRRLEAALLGGISLSVLLLSASGIYALMSFTVSQRRKEIGIRIALGAGRKRIVASIFSRAFAQLAVGAALGAAASAVLEKSSENNFMQGNAAVVLPIVASFMMVVGLVAALGPARRGLRIEPTEALREQ